MRTPTAVRDLIEARAVVALAAELADRLLDDRASCAPRRRSAAPATPRSWSGAASRERARALPLAAPLGRRGPASDGVSPRSARCRRLPPRRAVLVEELRPPPAASAATASWCVSPSRGIQRRAVADRDGRPAGARPVPCPSASPGTRRRIAIGTAPTPSSSAEPRRRRDGTAACARPASACPRGTRRALHPSSISSRALSTAPAPAARAVDRERAVDERGERLAPPHVEEVVARGADRGLAPATRRAACVMISVASRWLEWFEKNITGPRDALRGCRGRRHAQRQLVPQRAGASPPSGSAAARRRPGLGARPVGRERRRRPSRLGVRLGRARHERTPAPAEPLGHLLQLVAQPPSTPLTSRPRS